MTVLELKEKGCQEGENARIIMDTATRESRNMTSDEAHAYDEHLKKAEE